LRVCCTTPSHIVLCHIEQPHARSTVVSRKRILCRRVSPIVTTTKHISRRYRRLAMKLCYELFSGTNKHRRDRARVECPRVFATENRGQRRSRCDFIRLVKRRKKLYTRKANFSTSWKNIESWICFWTLNVHIHIAMFLHEMEKKI